MHYRMAALAATLGLIAIPALADVRAGVEAWGRGDYRKAIDEWRPLAVAGDADAQFNMGQAYKLGRGVPIDLAMAEEWYRKAAQQGHPQAADNYGLALFQSGKRDQALPWLEKSSTRGEPRTQYVLATMFFNGDVVKRDWVRAYALMTRSSASGLEQASGKLAEMDRYVSSIDRQKGTELARRYEAEAGRPIQRAEVSPVAVRPRLPDDVPSAPPNVAEPAVRDARPVRRSTQRVVRPLAARVQPTIVASGAWRAQLGAFRDPDGARRLWSQLAGRFPGRLPYIVKAGGLTRLLVGPFASQADAARGCGNVRPCVPMK